MITGCSTDVFFCGEFDAIPTDSFKETEIFLDSFGVEETVGLSNRRCCCRSSLLGTSANPNGMLDVIKNKIVIRDKTDFSLELPQHKTLQKFLGVELDLQKFGVDFVTGDYKNCLYYPLDSLKGIHLIFFYTEKYCFKKYHKEAGIAEQGRIP